MVLVAIIGGVVPDVVEYPHSANTKAVKEDLLGGYGKGILKLKGVGVFSKSLLASDYEYHCTAQPTGKTIIICSHSLFFALLLCIF